MLKPAGHEHNVMRNYVQPSDELVEKCLEYLDYLEEVKYRSSDKIQFAQLYTILADVDADVEETTGLFFHPLLLQHERYRNIGAFASFFFNDRIIELDVDAPEIAHVGHNFHGRVLINRGTLGASFGTSSSGIVINLGKTTWWQAADSYGVCINAGETGDQFGHSARGVIINAGVAGDWVGNGAEGVLINAGKVGELFGNNCEGPYVLLQKPEKLTMHKGFAMSLGPNNPPHEPTEEFGHYIDDLIACAREEPRNIKKRFGTARQIKEKIMGAL